MKKLIKRLTTLGYNLTTLEQHGNKIHFMHRQHLIIIEHSKGEYHLNINRVEGRFKNTFLTEHRLIVGISNYFC